MPRVAGAHAKRAMVELTKGSFVLAPRMTTMGPFHSTGRMWGVAPPIVLSTLRNSMVSVPSAVPIWITCVFDVGEVGIGRAHATLSVTWAVPSSGIRGPSHYRRMHQPVNELKRAPAAGQHLILCNDFKLPAKGIREAIREAIRR